MREELLRLIEEAELLRAKAEVEFNTRLVYHLGDAIQTMQWAYNELTKYDE